MRSQGVGIQLPLLDPSVCVGELFLLSVAPLASPPLVSWGLGGGIREGVLGYRTMLINSSWAATLGNHS